MRLLTITIMVLSLAVMGCGDDGDGGSTGGGTTGGGSTGDGFDIPENTTVEQRALTTAEWDLVVAQDEGLGQSVTDAAAAGFSDPIARGMLKDSNDAVVEWAIYQNPSDAKERILAKGCDGAGTCRSGRLAPDGSFRLADGTDDEPLLKVAPAMLKNLDGKDHTGPTKIAAALTKDEVPVVDLKTRKFVIANAFGPLYGIDLAGWKAVAESTGAFNQVDLHNYVSSAQVANELHTGSPFNALVWIGAAVRESLGPDHKTVGLTTNRGVYGDETFTATRVKELLAENPFGGPSLVVLVAPESRGDGSGQQDKNLSIFKEFSDAESGRVVVGFQGHAAPAELLGGAQIFLVAYFGGKSLADSLTEANTWLEEKGLATTLVSSRDSVASEIFFSGPLDSLWEGGESPKAVRSTHFLNITNKCFDSSGGVYSEDEGQANFFVDVDFDGPFFTGTRQNADVDLDVTVSGILLGKTPDSRIFIRIEGDLKPSMKGISVWGAGKLKDEFDKDNPSRIFYDGTALATDYTNSVGDNCILLTPKLSGATSQPSWIDLP